MKEGRNVFSIRDLENFSGIKAHTIRMWERRYRILEPERSDSNIRTYDECELKKILNIAYLNKHGFKISKIALLNNDELAQEVMTISGKSDNLNNHFQPGKILMSAIRFNEEMFIDSLRPFIRQAGMEIAYCRYFYPLLEQTRILWQTGTLSRAQEQFIRYAIKKLITIEDIIPGQFKRETSPTVAMIKTSENLSDINFLFYKYALRQRGFDVIFTGGIVSGSEAIEIFKIKPFQYLVVNSGAFDFTGKKITYFNNLGKSLKIKKIIFTDYPGETGTKHFLKIVITRNPDDFIKYIDTIPDD
jgi:DNA-binding transcriptional MerR regulator